MAYELRFTATDDADWSEAVELIDDNTNGPLLEAADATFELQVAEDCDGPALSISTTDGGILKPEDNIISWTFTRDQLGSLDTGRTYNLGCRMTLPDGQSVMLFTGTLVYVDGGMSWR